MNINANEVWTFARNMLLLILISLSDYSDKIVATNHSTLHKQKVGLCCKEVALVKC
jgi:hypothetical protein